MSYQTCDQVSPECPVEYTIYGDYFTLGATATYASLFGLLLVAQGFLAFRGRTWSFGAWLFAGTSFEFIGYVARSFMTDNPWNFDAFIAQNLCLVLGPTLVAAAISVTFKHLVVWHGPEHSYIKAWLYPWVFVGTDFISICIQSAGGAIASIAESDSAYKLGNNMLLAGVSFQVVNMTFCGGLILSYVWRRKRALAYSYVRADGVSDEPANADIPCYQGTPETVARNRRQVKMFIWSLALAYIVILIRCIYRLPEMAMGWGSTLMQNEATFMTLDGGMLLIACGSLTIFHPALFFPFMAKTQSKQGQEQHVENEHEMGRVEKNIGTDSSSRDTETT